MTIDVLEKYGEFRGQINDYYFIVSTFIRRVPAFAFHPEDSNGRVAAHAAAKHEFINAALETVGLTKANSSPRQRQVVIKLADQYASAYHHGMKASFGQHWQHLFFNYLLDLKEVIDAGH